MSLAPDTLPAVIDLFSGTGTSTSTGAGVAFALPAGKKAIQVSLVTSATMTVKIQNSVDNANWFDVSSSTVSPGYLAETDSVVKWWRVNVTAVTTTGTGTANAVAQICYAVPR